MPRRDRAAVRVAPPCACYVRVSTDAQTVANQLAEVRALAEARGFAPVVFEEKESAAARRRPVFERMLDEVRAGRVRAVAVWAIDRLHRSMVGSIQTVLEFDRLAVPLFSVREPWLDMDSPARSLLVAVFGWVAEQERKRLVERLAAARERLEREGRSWGRPPRFTRLERDKVQALAKQGFSVREIAIRVHAPRSTVHRALQAPSHKSGPRGRVVRAAGAV